MHIYIGLQFWKLFSNLVNELAYLCTCLFIQSASESTWYLNKIKKENPFQTQKYYYKALVGIQAKDSDSIRETIFRQIITVPKKLQRKYIL